jgi:hypothetical protein
LEISAEVAAELDVLEAVNASGESGCNTNGSSGHAERLCHLQGDGTRANVAFFTWKYCNGSPIFYDGTDQKLLDMLFCMNESHGYNSLASWCEGTGPSFGF